MNEHKKNKKVYVMQVNANGIHIHKVGISSDPNTRVKSISTGCPLPVKIVYTTELCVNADRIERMVHMILKDYHSNGEWYACDLGVVMSALNSLQNGEIKKTFVKLINRQDWKPDLSLFTEKEIDEISSGKRRIHACKRFFVPHGIPWPPPHKWKKRLMDSISSYKNKSDEFALR